MALLHETTALDGAVVTAGVVSAVVPTRHVSDLTKACLHGFRL